MILYDYQQSFISDIGIAFKKNPRIVGQLPTGAGKGVILAEIARRSIAKGNVVCISCHRIEIFEQLFTNLRAFGITPSLISAGQYPMAGAQCYLSMVETFCRRMSRGLVEKLNINFFILDEVHFGSYYKLVNELKQPVLGLTATPKSTGKPDLNKYFDDIVCGCSIRTLIKERRLVPTKTFSIDYDFSKVKMKGKEYDDRALFAEFRKPKLYHGAVDSYMKNAKGLQALCFCVNVEHSNETALQFRELGVRAAHVDATTSKEDRHSLFQMFRNGDLDVLCNVGIATTGTDLPDTQCVIQNFATTSLVKHVQTLGRGSRTAEGKERFITIDMGRNYIRHGEYGEDIDWRFIFNHPEAATKKEPKKEKRECDECGAVIKLHLTTCPYCGATKTRDEIEEILLKDASIKEIRDYRLKTVPPHLRKSYGTMSHAELVAYGRHMGYSPKWVWVIERTRR